MAQSIYLSVSNYIFSKNVLVLKIISECIFGHLLCFTNLGDVIKRRANLKHLFQESCTSFIFHGRKKLRGAHLTSRSLSISLSLSFSYSLLSLSLSLSFTFHFECQSQSPLFYFLSNSLFSLIMLLLSTFFSVSSFCVVPEL